MNRIQIRLSVALVAVLLAALAFLSLRTAERAETLLLPEVGAKAETVARSVAGLVTRADDVGIPLDRLVGLDTYLQRLIDGNPDLAFIGLLDADGRVRYWAGTESSAPGARVPLDIAGSADGLTLAVDLDPEFARSVVYKLWIDLAIVMVVTALVALELVYISFGVGLYGAIEGVEQRLQAIQRGDLRRHEPVAGGSNFGDIAARLDQRLTGVAERLRAMTDAAKAAGDSARLAVLEALRAKYRLGEVFGDAPVSVIAIRAPLFVFMFAEELTRPFLPIFIQRLASPIPGLSPALVISLPMVVFLAIVALAQPVLGTVTERAGRRRSLMLGAALGAAGYVATAYAFDLLGLTLARAVTAVGFALVFVAAQGFVIDATSGRQRARGMAVFIGAILVAGLCGPPIGGILADRLGMQVAFLVAGALAAASLGLAAMALPRTPRGADAVPSIRWRDFTATLSSPRLAALLFLCALPAKVVLVAFCFFLTPLQMEALGQDQAATGRMLMIYPLAMVLLVPAFASLADRADRQVMLVAGGGLIAGLGGYAVLIDPTSLYALGAMLLLLGLGQAMSIASQSALVGTLGRQLSPAVPESSLYGIFRLVERTGSAIGPVVAGALLGLYGFTTATALIGTCVAIGALLFALASAIGRRTGDRPAGPMIEGRTA